MRIFVTGASGFIGSTVVPELIGAGHQVVGLARSDASATALAAAGAEVHRGALDDLASLRAGAEGSDGVIHLAYRHDLVFSGQYAGAAEADLRAIETLGTALVDSGRPFVIASGTVGLLTKGIATEHDVPDPASAASARAGGAQATLALAARGVRTCVVRLPPSVHGPGDHHGFIPILIGIARERGVSAYIGDGSNRWPAVHRLDAARLFQLAIETVPAGSVLHAVADEGVPVRAIAELVGRHLGIPVASISQADAGAHFGWFASFLGAHAPASSALTRELLGWTPTHPGLIADLDEGHYFRAAGH